MQNPISKLRQSSIISVKPDYLFEIFFAKYYHLSPTKGYQRFLNFFSDLKLLIKMHKKKLVSVSL